MSFEHEKLLLQGYHSPKGRNQLVLNAYSTESAGTTKYFQDVIEKYSKSKIISVLEIYPADGISIDKDLRKIGYKVTSIPFKLEVNAVGGDKEFDGEHYIIGNDFHLPKLNQKFDAIIVSQGSFGQVITQSGILDLISYLHSSLMPKGILMAEIWHFNGINISSTKKGLKYWEQIESRKDLSILRLTNSKLNIISSILEVDLLYIIQNQKEKTYEKYAEMHLYRLYCISELTGLFSSLFSLKEIFKMNTFEEPDLKTFRLLAIALKND